jgi:hypothetical protein
MICVQHINIIRPVRLLSTATYQFLCSSGEYRGYFLWQVRVSVYICNFQHTFLWGVVYKKSDMWRPCLSVCPSVCLSVTTPARCSLHRVSCPAYVSFVTVGPAAIILYLEWVNEFLYAILIFLDWLWWNLILAMLTRCHWAVVSFMKISAMRVILHQWMWMKLCLVFLHFSLKLM